MLLDLHWVFDAFDFQNSGGNLGPSLNNENIGGVGLGLRIARDIFATGNRLAPKMTPDNVATPPISTPAPGSPMPVVPEQPADAGGCTDAVAQSGSGKVKKAVAKVLGKKGGKSDAAWPAGVSEQDGERAGSTAQGGWPSGISEK